MSLSVCHYLTPARWVRMRLLYSSTVHEIAKVSLVHASELVCPVLARPRRLFLLLIVKPLLVANCPHTYVMFRKLIDLSLVKVRRCFFVQDQRSIWGESSIISYCSVWRFLSQLDLWFTNVVLTNSWHIGPGCSMSAHSVRTALINVIAAVGVSILQNISLERRKVSLSWTSRESVLRCSGMVTIFSVLKRVKSQRRIR